MIKILKIIFVGILTSFFFFPVEFQALPGINTKMMLAAIGLVLFVFTLVQKREFSIPKELLVLLFLACLVSLVALFSITINHTPDMSYVTYIVSLSVWMSAAFVVCVCIKAVHGRIDVELVLDYLTGVCVFQCIISLLINFNPAVQRLVDSIFRQGQELLQEMGRLYGIGASLDVAGSRFSTVIAGLGLYLSESKFRLSLKKRNIYILSFVLITVIGNMIARTTLVGTIIGLGIILVSFLFTGWNALSDKIGSLASWLILLLFAIIVSVYLYRTDAQYRDLFRFAFEGFFNLVEEGTWETNSTAKLQTMVVFPETMHTWIIGDGYFNNARSDINYVGDSTDQGFYMGTDVGYLRFIFYFGIIGLIAMIAIVSYSAVACMRRFWDEKIIFVLALIVGLIVWFKVATDVFLFFALFLCAAFVADKEEYKLVS